MKLDKEEETALLSKNEKTVLRAKLCQLLYISKQSCPDIAFDVTDLADKINTHTVEDLKKLDKIIKKVGPLA